MLTRASALNPDRQPRRRRAPHISDDSRPDHRALLPRLGRIQGQLTGIQKMIAEGRYCVDILTQLRAVSSAVVATEGLVLEKHLKSCIEDALLSKDATEVDDKIQELVTLLVKRIKL